MKYIKNFESKTKIDYKFKIGDYVVILDRKPEAVGKIISDDYIYYINILYANGGDEYAEPIDLIPATPEQIEQYELEEKMNKYNL